MAEVRIEGLRELRTELRGFEAHLARAGRLAGARAADMVERTAKPRVPLGPALGGHLVSSLHALPSQGAVVEGGAQFPYTGWLDFGGTINKHTRHPTHRPFVRHGRYIWAAFSDRHQAVLDIYQDELMRAAREAGLEGR